MSSVNALCRRNFSENALLRFPTRRMCKRTLNREEYHVHTLSDQSTVAGARKEYKTSEKVCEKR